MPKLLTLVLCGLFVGLGLNQSVAASPLQAYYDKASWNAAVAGLAIHPYTAGATETIYEDTYSTGGAPDCPQQDGYCFIGSTVTDDYSDLRSIGGIMSYPNSCFDCSAIQRITIDLDEPILAFAALSGGYNFFAGLAVNGFDLPENPPYYAQFFGLVGSISTLDFTVSPFTDNPGTLDLYNIVVATAPEPPSWTLLFAGLFGWMAWSASGAFRTRPSAFT